MTIDRGAPPKSGGRRGGRPVSESGETKPADARLRVTYDAFCQTHERAWQGFARTQVGTDQDAAVVVEAVKEHLLRNWALALRQEIPAAYAWRLLKEHIAAWLVTAGQQRPALVQTAAFDVVIRHFRDQARVSLETLPEQLGLFSAVLELPERQHDVVVLKYVLDLDDEKIAEYLGTTPATLRSNLRHARRRLARVLGRAESAECGDER